MYYIVEVEEAEDLKANTSCGKNARTKYEMAKNSHEILKIQQQRRHSAQVFYYVVAFFLPC